MSAPVQRTSFGEGRPARRRNGRVIAQLTREQEHARAEQQRQWHRDQRTHVLRRYGLLTDEETA